MKGAPITRDATLLSVWLVRHFTHDHELDRRVVQRALDLAEALTLALQGLERLERLLEADRHLAALRAVLRIAFEASRMDDRQVLHVHGLCDAIGRQLGGLLKAEGAQ